VAVANDARQPTFRTGARRRVHEPSAEGASWRRRLLAGGTEGNERLTVLTGLLLIVLLAVLGVTIIRIGQLLWLHLFLGLLLLGPVALKLSSTGYRFARYYTSAPAYREKGPPAPALRGLAPFVVFFTLAVFATGVALLVLGPSARQPLVLLHKVSFFAWLAFTALHVLGHLPEIIRLLSNARRSRREIIDVQTAWSHGRRPPAPTSAQVAGRQGRGAALIVALLGGLVIAVALIGQFSVWTH
jgi:hypothetical protein